MHIGVLSRLRQRYGDDRPASPPPAAASSQNGLLSDPQLADYEVSGSLGSGGFAGVWKAQERGGSAVAIKQCIDAFRDSTDARHVYREVLLQRAAEHPAILPIKRVLRATNGRDLYLVLPRMATDLQAALRANTLKQPARRSSVICQLLRALHYLHRHGVVHRDVKPANCLLHVAADAVECRAATPHPRASALPANARARSHVGCPRPRRRLKLCDFGLARLASGPVPVSASSVGSLWYRAPEVLLGTRHGRPVDLWSAGCILAELWRAGGKVLLLGASEAQQVKKIVELVGKPAGEDLAALGIDASAPALSQAAPKPRGISRLLLPGTPGECCDLIAQLLSFDPRKRPDAAAALQHAFLAPHGGAHPEAGDEPPKQFVLPFDDERLEPAHTYRAYLYTAVVENPPPAGAGEPCAAEQLPAQAPPAEAAGLDDDPMAA